MAATTSFWLLLAGVGTQCSQFLALVVCFCAFLASLVLCCPLLAECWRLLDASAPVGCSWRLLAAADREKAKQSSPKSSRSVAGVSPVIVVERTKLDCVGSAGPARSAKANFQKKPAAKCILMTSFLPHQALQPLQAARSARSAMPLLSNAVASVSC